MEQKQEICPYCGGTELVKGKQYGHGSMCRYNAGGFSFLRSSLIHLICCQCGTVVRSYVENPEYFAK